VNAIPLGGASATTGVDNSHYKGYEQAVFEFAQLRQIQQAREQAFGVPAQRTEKKGGRFAGQWVKRPKVPKEPVDPRKYFCEVCNVTCAGPQSFQVRKR
jgi:hypothetical protein